MPNRLANENSPYLLQHANNPVDWFPWGAEALTKARAENKPIFLSIGYAACHWCHVMEHESFEDPAIAELMNRHFVNIKVDREQRPDLDSIYMAATVSMTGSGGWPMSVFLTPNLQPFYAGTYFPPVPRYNMPSFRDLLSGISRAWQEERTEVDKVAANVSAHLLRQNTSTDSGIILSQKLLESAAKYLHDNYDWGFGGWGGAPKFPQPMTIDFLLRRSLAPGQPDQRKSALHALQAMARGGMYDVVGGGFSRYSTDNHWRVPHFEKMLYDNAQLVRAYLHAWQVTGEPFYRRIVEQSLDFVLRELSDPQGGFYSSLDADSEGVEGKFYVWDAAEIEQTLSKDWEFFKAAYGVSAQGNWEGRTVLQRALDDSTLSARFALPEAGVAAKLAECHRKLLAAREKRIRPGLDDKVLTGWNGLMLSAFAEAARAFEMAGNDGFEAKPEISHSKYLRAATRSADFLLREMRPNGKLCRTWRTGKTSPEVFLEDYAALVLGLLDLYETDFNNRWFAAAQELADEMITRFADPDGGFFDSPSDGETLLLRPKELQDNATPSGNALAVEALLRLAALTDRADYRTQAEQAFRLVAENAVRHPTAFARWLGAADFALSTVKQVAVVGDPAQSETRALLAEIRASWRPNQVAAASALPLAPNSPPLLADRPLLAGKPTAYVCEGFVCKIPVNNPEELKNLLENK
ncbi:MAG: thioredoxin domain-containing protein [Chloroflexi bacterium HGW-Chloroflexi-6]|nr:MAG: thioredoxin domain-containing protein [Chloroflexi bacterium HGW-Chloroflexi-6]